MTTHPIKALGDMLLAAGKKSEREEMLAIARRTFSPAPVLNINSLDPKCPHGRDMSQAETEWDIEYARRRGDYQYPLRDPNGAGS